MTTYLYAATTYFPNSEHSRYFGTIWNDQGFKRLQVLFNNGKVKLYDCNQLLQRPAFYMLRDDAFFNVAKVDSGGYGISWNDDVDLSEYELWTNGIEVAPSEPAPV